MEHHVLQVDREVEHDDGDRDRERQRQLDAVEQAPAVALGGQRARQCRGREQHAQDQRIEQHQAEVVDPAVGLGDGQPAARCAQLP
ncbi:MAG: hypothetical protein QNJ91_17890 [Gammaproteobacteria bacterium]|nr:hypothetical protein [Gammaproteobacteria bacterium]